MTRVELEYGIQISAPAEEIINILEGIEVVENDEPNSEISENNIDDEELYEIIKDIFPNYEPDNFSENDFIVSNKLIKLEPDDLMNLFNLFEPTMENFEKVILVTYNYC